jgi:hypothetical protein
VAVYDDGTPLVMPAKSVCANVNNVGGYKAGAGRSSAYADSALVHVHTLSLHDMVQKALLTAYAHHDARVARTRPSALCGRLMIRARPSCAPGCRVPLKQ